MGGKFKIVLMSQSFLRKYQSNLEIFFKFFVAFEEYLKILQTLQAVLEVFSQILNKVGKISLHTVRI